MNGRLDQKVAIITGAASGIGAAAARLFAAEGAKVVLGDVQAERGAAIAGELGPAAAIFVPLDVTDKSSWERAVARCTEEFGSPSCLVSNAGVNFIAPIETTGEAEMRRLFEVNVLGVHFGLQAVVAPMKANGGGSIVITSSVAGLIGLDWHGAYAASKAAGAALARCAAIELGPFGIRVNSVHPGNIETPMREGVAQSSPMRQADRDARIEALPAGRVGRADEVAQMMLFLCSDESSYVTGSQLLVDGGMLAGPRVIG
jgi:3alpha(or 20beta)-hydroxysteroid dehydrogenase